MANSARKVGELAVRVLKSAGFEVLEAADGQAALEVFTRAADRVRFVLLDLMMPRLDGVQTLQDLIDFVVARILDQLGVEHDLMKRWGS